MWVMLLSAITYIGAAQTDTTRCLKATLKDCAKMEQQPPCPQLQRKSSCMLNTAKSSEQPSKKENSDE